MFYDTENRKNFGIWLKELVNSIAVNSTTIVILSSCNKNLKVLSFNVNIDRFMASVLVPGIRFTACTMHYFAKCFLHFRKFLLSYAAVGMYEFY